MVSVTVIGPLAGLQRLLVKELPNFSIDKHDSQDGAAGQLITPSLSSDAPTVGLRLAADGIKCLGIFNYPGSSPLSIAVHEFIKARLYNVIVGLDCGDAFDLQVVSHDGKFVWFTDTQPTIKSLASIHSTYASIPSSVAYIDAYQWLKDVPFQLIPREWHGILLVNLGKRDFNTLFTHAKRWRQSNQNCRIAFQISIGDSSLSEDTLLDPNFIDQLKGIDFVIITRGINGVCVTSGQEVFMLPAIHPENFQDSSGAGASVSAAICRLLVKDDHPSIQVIAQAAIEAGTKQCTISGTLDAISNNLWHKFLDRKLNPRV